MLAADLSRLDTDDRLARADWHAGRTWPVAGVWMASL